MATKRKQQAGRKRPMSLAEQHNRHELALVRRERRLARALRDETRRAARAGAKARAASLQLMLHLTRVHDYVAVEHTRYDELLKRVDNTQTRIEELEAEARARDLALAGARD